MRAIEHSDRWAAQAVVFAILLLVGLGNLLLVEPRTLASLLIGAGFTLVGVVGLMNAVRGGRTAKRAGTSHGRRTG